MKTLSRLARCAPILVVLGLWGCKPATPPAEVPEPVAAPSTAPSTASALTPQAQLDALDPRIPVPLQPMMAWHQKQNMQEHLVAIEQVVGALAQENWDEVAKASAKIESSPARQTMCQHMGAGADGFTQRALDFHARADAIGKAAQMRDTKAVLEATAHTLQACTGCHAAYRQEIVDAETWQARTGTTHTPEKSH